MIINVIPKYPQFALYGAQVVAYGAYAAIKHLLNRTPECFVVSSLEGNPEEIDNIEVRILDSVDTEMLIILAVTELLQDEISEVLEEKGYKNVFKLTAHEEHLLMSAYYTDLGIFTLALESSSVKKIDFSLFEVCHHLDKPLQNISQLEFWEIPIQAGAVLTHVRICELLDNSGDNISNRNKEYCEASVVYWAWKNVMSQWIGIEHYRRHILVNPNMLNDDVDVILPLPYMCYPNFRTQFSRFVINETIDALLAALKSLYPNEYGDYVRCLDAKYHYAYNLIVAKRSVFSEYCEWVFNITGYIESLGIPNIQNTRALSYVVEMLTSIYFMSNKNGLKIKHAEKAIYK